MLNEARYQEDWGAAGGAPVRPHLETNRWLDAVKGTRAARPRSAPESETFDLLGVQLVWTKDRGRAFPEPVLSALKRLVEFAGLSEGWNSYNGRPLQQGAVRPVIEYIIRAHKLAQVPRLHPLPDGGVGLSWGHPDDELDLTVSPNGSVEGLLTMGDQETELPVGSSWGKGMELLEQYLAAR